jgi:hypothetical protein
MPIEMESDDPNGPHRKFRLLADALIKALNIIADGG